MPKLWKWKHGSWLRLALIALLALALAAVAVPTFAQDGGPETAGLAATTEDVARGLNVMWVMLCGALIFFMQAGFALVEAGFTRAKNVAHTMTMNMMVFCIGAIGYWLTGFGLQFGGLNFTYPDLTNALPAWSFAPVTLGAWTDAAGNALLASPLLVGGSGVLGLTGFMLGGLSANMGVLVFFVFQMVFMDTAATIPTGSMAERMSYAGFALMSMWVCMFLYPLTGNWVWGGGWLANLGRSAGWGNGAVDFAGSGVVHLVGGSIALAGALALGPRLGKFNPDGSANSIPGHNLPMGVLGTIILFFGWLGFNPGSSLGLLGGLRSLAVLAAVNTLLAGAAGGVSAMSYMWFVHKLRKPDPAMSVNGVLAGLVAITAACAFVTPLAAVVVGLSAGVLVCAASALLEKLKIDDPVGAIPVHFFNGLLGVMAVGLFANGNPASAMWNGVSTPVTGLFYGGGAGQLLAQLAEGLALPVTAFASSYAFFLILMRLRLLRVSREVELAGLDLPEMGTEGYPKDWEPTPEALGLRRPRTAPAGLAAAAGD